MKTFACALLLIAVASAEPARFRQTRYSPVEQELPLEDDREATTPKSREAPYPDASGYTYSKPKVQLNLPSLVPFSQVQFAPPSTSYGVPADSYTAPVLTYYNTPSVNYGVPAQIEPKSRTDKPVEELTTEKPSEPEASKEEFKPNQSDSSNSPGVVASGAYYVLLPNADLQRVQFRTENDLANMAYTAKLQYKNEDRAPIFIYTNIPQACSSCGASNVAPATPAPYYYY